LALIGGTPKKSSAGKVMKLPPPAIELRMPPKKPAVKSDSNLKSIFINPTNLKYSGEFRFLGKLTDQAKRDGVGSFQEFRNLYTKHRCITPSALAFG
jgi:hypothetical protein